jgi:hypothetical protein
MPRKERSCLINYGAENLQQKNVKGTSFIMNEYKQHVKQIKLQASVTVKKNESIELWNSRKNKTFSLPLANLLPVNIGDRAISTHTNAKTQC